MAASNPFNVNPLFKLSIPLMIGIAVAWYCGLGVRESLPLGAVSLFILLFGLSSKAPKWLFGVGVTLFMLAVGVFVESKQRAQMEPQWVDGNRAYKAQLLEVPLHKGTVTKVLAYVEDVDTALVSNARAEGEAYIYLQRSVEADALEVGDVLRFKAEMKAPVNAGNPAEFDYSNYCRVKGITGSAYVWGGNWERVGKGKKSLAMRALAVRERVVNKYRTLGFDDDDLLLLSALTVGEKRDFSKELKENYAAAGASHVLALSGLHLGILYLLLSVLLPFRGRKGWQMVLRETVILMSLWTFAYIAGLPASVVRSAILFTLMSLGRCLRQDASSISSLSFAAIAMLLFSPHLLFDVSFQLSFSAVLSILLLAPYFQRVLRVDERSVLYRYVLNLLILTVAAQLGTLPFVWYHFGVLPLYSLLTNIFVVPLAFVTIALTLLMLVTSFIGPLRLQLTVVLQFVTGLMNDGIAFVASLPGASFSLPPIGVPGAVCVAMLLVALLCALIGRKWWLASLVGGCSLVFCVVGVSLASSDDDSKGVIVYNNNKNPLLHIVSADGDNWLLSTVPQLDAEYEYVSSPYVKREKLPEPRWVDGDYVCGEFGYVDGVVKYGGLKIRLLADEQWRDNIFAEPVDVLILCRGFLGPVKELVEVYPTACLLLDASLYKRSRDRILRECATLWIEVVDISRTGAVKIVPHGDEFEINPLRGK